MKDQYNVVPPCEAWERERDLYPRPISAKTWDLLRKVGLLKYYEEATSLKVHSSLLAQLIRCWNVQEQSLHVGPKTWYRSSKEDIYFIIGLSRRGEDFPEFLDVPYGVAVESHLVYSHRYVTGHVVRPTYFQMRGGKLWIAFFFA